MAKKRVIAYCMHEYEFAAVAGSIDAEMSSPSYVTGTMEEADIVRLEAQGILIEVVEKRPEGVARGGMAREQAKLRGVAAASADLEGMPRDPVLHPTKDNIFMVSIAGTMLHAAWRQDLEALGVSFLEHIPVNRYSASLSLAQAGALEDLAFVEDVRLLTPEESGGVVFSEVARAAPGLEGSEDAVLTYDLLLHRESDLDDVKNWLSARQIVIAAEARRKIRVELLKGSDLTREIEALPEVAQIQEFVLPVFTNEVARGLLGLADAAGAAQLTQTGEGQIVAIADSGLDEHHPDFAGRVDAAVPLGRVGDASDPHGHGTHVAGSVLGDGAASNGVIKGAAPKARLFFQSIMGANGQLSGLPIDLKDLFQAAHDAGARIHNNSWSADTKSFYTFNSLEVDEFVEKQPDTLIVIAAGNEGSAEAPFNSNDGFVDWLSIGSPATAKNALTVGASRSARTIGGLADRTFKQFNPTKFPSPPISNENLAGQPEGLAAFSSRGPCDPRRIKPDVVAPGTCILSTRASTAPEDNFWETHDGSYAFLGGTSMAAPLVSGCAALVRQYYAEDRQVEPSAALLKGTIINSTKWLGAEDAVADHPMQPNYHQGFGMVYMPFAIPNPHEDWMRLEFVDTWKDEPKRLTETGDRRRFAFQVSGGRFLRLCLTWTDPAAGAALQNNLGLLLEHGGLTPPKVVGNAQRPSPVGRLDRDNNVQVVRIENPPPGNYMVAVFAGSLLRPPQDYALVVTGAVNSGLTSV